MTSRPVRFVLPATIVALALFAAPIGRADEPPAPPPAPAPGAKPDKVPDAPAVKLADRAEGVMFEEGAPKFEDVLKKAKDANKPIFVDFMTEW